MIFIVVDHSRIESCWLLCPVCKIKTRTKILEDKVLIKCPLYCAKYKQETLVDIARFKVLPHREPDV